MIRHNKSGFTLVELLAVIVILAIILAIAVPGISNIIDISRQSAFESDAKMVLKQLEYEKLKDESFDVTTVNIETLSNFNLSNENYEDIRIDLVDNKPYIIIVGKNKWEGLKACGTFRDIVLVPANDTETCEDIPIPIFNASKGVNRPRLVEGMTPIKWNGSAWVDTTETDNDWYNYTTSDKKWANAKTADGSMWVWIPRYVYKISNGWHTNAAGEIDIQFSTETDDTKGGKVILDTGNTSNASNKKWTNHPAFKFGNIELTGIWVAKFEASGTIGAISSKPNLNSIAGPTIGELFTAGRNMETNSIYGWGTSGVGIDTHMAKNIEWGAIVYLSKSTYGKETEEVWINPTAVTGCAGDTVSSSSTGSCLYEYNTENGMKASTTGNIYGIYDMSGGRKEYTAAYANTLYASYGGALYNADSKYKDVYPAPLDYESNNYAETQNKKGDAIWETSSGYGTGSWYNDSSNIAYQNLPFYNRGGQHVNKTAAGIFNFGSYNSDVGTYSFRPILLVDEDL